MHSSTLKLHSQRPDSYLMNSEPADAHEIGTKAVAISLLKTKHIFSKFEENISAHPKRNNLGL